MEEYLEKVKFIVAKEKENRAEEIKSCIQQIKSITENKITQLIEINKHWPLNNEKLEYVETISESERIHCYITSKSVEIAHIFENEDTHQHHVIRFYNSGETKIDFGFDTLQAYRLFLKYFPKLEKHVHSMIDKRFNDLQEIEVKMETKYILQETADRIIKFMETCKEVHPNIAFKVKDTEGYVTYTKNIEKIISEIDGRDEEFGFNIVDRETKEFLGWFCILPYEEDFICDYSDNDFCKEVCNRLENEFGK